VATRGSVKDIIETEINLITAKISSLHQLSSEPSDDVTSWAAVITKKNKKDANYT
jgi:hypothetical protein